MAAPGGIWVPMAQRILRQALAAGGRAAKALRSHINSAAARTEQHQPSSHQLSYVHVQQQPLHPIALRRQLKRTGNSSSKWFSTSSRASGRIGSRVSGRIGGGSTLHRPANFLRATLQRFMSSGSGSGSGSGTRISTAARILRSTVATQSVWKATGRAPFASTLRPNLTGGALPRTAGGYTLGGGAGRGGARYFSHAPAAPAQVVQNVSQAMRAFWLSGQRARFDGCDSQGRPCYAAVGVLEQETARRMVSAVPRSGGAFIDFSLVPTVTACGGVAVAAPKKTGLKQASVAAASAFPSPPAPTLQTDGFLDVLGVDFARTLRDLGAVMADLKRLAALGDLPVTMAPHGTALRVRFPGVDAATVDRLCEDLGITRGVVGEDPGGWQGVVGATKATAKAAYATPTLRFPFAPEDRAVDVLSDVSDLSTEENALLFGNAAGWPPHSSSHSSCSLHDVDDRLDYEGYFGEWADEGNPWRMSSLPAGSSLLDVVDYNDYNDVDGGYESQSPPLPPTASSGIHASSELESVEGVYRFLGECERHRSLFG